jgi:hypothetical protein
MDERMKVGIAATMFSLMPPTSPLMEAIISSVRKPPFATENLLRSVLSIVLGLKFTVADERRLRTVLACHRSPKNKTMMTMMSNSSSSSN